MKKIIFTVIMVLGFTSIYAFNGNENNPSNVTVSRNIEISELPEHIQNTLVMEYKNYLVKSAEVEMVEDGIYVYTITLVDAENLETTIMFTDEVQNA